MPASLLADQIYQAERAEPPFEAAAALKMLEEAKTPATEPDTSMWARTLYMRAALVCSRWHLAEEEANADLIAYNVLDMKAVFGTPTPTPPDTLLATLRYDFALANLIAHPANPDREKIRSNASAAADFFYRNRQVEFAAKAYLLAAIMAKELSQPDRMICERLSRAGYHFANDRRQLALMRWALGTGGRNYAPNPLRRFKTKANIERTDFLPYCGRQEPKR